MNTIEYFSFLLFAFILASCSNKNAEVATTDVPDSLIPVVEMEVRCDTFPLVVGFIEKDSLNNMDGKLVYGGNSGTSPSNTLFIEGTFFNNTNKELMYGEDFKVQVYNDSTWQNLAYRSDIVFNSLGYLLFPGTWRNFRHPLYVNLYDYKPGRYRIMNELMVTFELEFTVLDSPSSDKRGIPVVDNAGKFAMEMSRDTISVKADTLCFTVRNNSVSDICPYENYFLYYYDEGRKEWMHYYQPNSRDEPKRKLVAGESSVFKIPLNIKRSKNAQLYQGKYFLRPGKYKIHKYVDIPVNAEFVLSDDNKVRQDYKRLSEEQPLRDVAQYPDGDSVLYKYLKQEMKLPVPESSLHEYSYAHGTLMVDTVGRASDPRIRNLSDTIMRDETMRLLNLLKEKQWIPARNTRGIQPSERRIEIRYRGF